MTSQFLPAGQGRGGFSVWRATLSGLCASCVGIGLARFAYTPLIPALIGAGWFSPADAAYLGAANLAGYLAGALLSRRLIGRWPAATILRAMMLLGAASFFACAAPMPFSWFFVWRLASGIAGGALMVLAAPAILPYVQKAMRGRAGGVIFTGVGLGVALSGTLIPILLSEGLTATWLGLGILALLLTAVAWNGWPSASDIPPAPPREIAETPAPAAEQAGEPVRVLRALYVEYALNAIGTVPHMVFLVDFVSRGLGQGIGTGSWCWILFGLGACAGPMVTGTIADRIGFRLTLRLCFAVQAIGVAALATTSNIVVVALVSPVLGALVPGVVPVVLGRVTELIPHDAGRRNRAWSLATSAFALGQAASAYLYSFLFASGFSYTTLFAMGTATMVTALAIDLAFSRKPAAALPIGLGLAVCLALGAPSAWAQDRVAFRIHDHLDPAEIAETTGVYVNGELIRTIQLDADHPYEMVTVSLPPDPTATYALCGRVTIRTPAGDAETHEVDGSGTLTDFADRDFDAVAANDFRVFYLTDITRDRPPIQVQIRHARSCAEALS